jgi:hypothetical protein
MASPDKIPVLISHFHVNRYVTRLNGASSMISLNQENYEKLLQPSQRAMLQHEVLKISVVVLIRDTYTSIPKYKK